MSGILADTRPIEKITWKTPKDWWMVGVGTSKGIVSRIAPYGEPGQGAMVPWVAIYAVEALSKLLEDNSGERLVARADCAGATIVYKDDP